jgi:mRNA interferase RelE/StbE
MKSESPYDDSNNPKTPVSIGRLKRIHEATHPGASLETKKPASANTATPDAVREESRKANLLAVLDARQASRILKFLQQWVARLDDPRRIAEVPHGSRLGEFWKYRAGDNWRICKIEDDRLVVLVLRAGRGKEIYRRWNTVVSGRRTESISG